MDEIQNLQKQIDSINKALKDLQKDPSLPDHQHTGFDSTRVRFRDIDTIFAIQATINPSSLIDGAGETVTVSNVSGATLGDFVLVAPPYDLVGIIVTGWVSANSTVKIRIQNETGGTVDLASGIWRIVIIRKVV